jgi:hypothetical protein
MTMAATTYIPDLEKSIEREIERLRSQRGQAPSQSPASAPATASAPPMPPSPQAAPAPAPTRGGAWTAPGAPLPTASAPVAGGPPADMQALSRQIDRLQQLRAWMTDDPAFGRLVDSVVGRQVTAAERRQKAYALGLTVASSGVSLIAGWLLSALNPGTALAHLFLLR